MKQTGVYKIEHIASGRLYVGSGLCIRGRLRAHLNKLRRGTHHSRYLQNAWNKFGESDFRFAPILLCRPQDRIFYEQAVMDFYQSYEKDRGFNIRRRAESNAGLATSPNQKAALSAYMRDPIRSAKTRLAAIKEMNRPERIQQSKAILTAIGNDKELQAKRLASCAAANIRRCKGVPISAEMRAKFSEAAKRSYANGRICGARKISPETIYKALCDLRLGKSRRQIARETGIDRKTIYDILRGRLWKDVMARFLAEIGEEKIHDGKQRWTKRHGSRCLSRYCRRDQRPELRDESR